MSELVIARNHLEACQSWQEVINAQTTDAAKNEAGHEAIKSLKGQSYYGTRKIIVNADAAMHLPDDIDPLEEAVWPALQFPETIAQGWLGRLTYRRYGKEAFIDWTLYNPRVLGPSEDEFIGLDELADSDSESSYHLPINQALNRPLHFPVGLINSVICYDDR